MTDLDAFFAKKASKGKKKGVIKLEEISEQLEKRALEQKDEIDDNENKSSEDSNNKNRSINENNEDSEWLGFDAKPNVTVAIKEMADSYIESEDEEKKTSAEPTKTWKINNQEISGGEVTVVESKPTKYVVRAKKEDQLDLKSEEMFPSIKEAPEVEQKLKKEEEIKRRTKIEERKQEEKEREEKEKRENIYKARRAVGGEISRKPMDKERRQLQETEPSESDKISDWRAEQKPREEEKERPAKGAIASHQLNAANKSGEEETSWRSKPAGIVSSADSQENWRNKPNTPAAPQRTVQVPQTQTLLAHGGSNAYIPPHKRGENRSD